MNHAWQQPIRAMEYQLLNTDLKHVWAPVLFIRPTNHGWQIMGEPGLVWGPDSVTLRVVGA